MKFSLLLALTLSTISLVAGAAPQCLETKFPVIVSKFSKDGFFKEIVTPIKQGSQSLDVIIKLRSQGEIAYYSIADGSDYAIRLPVKDLPDINDHLLHSDNLQFEVSTVELGNDGKKQLVIVLCNPPETYVEVFSIRNGKWALDLSENLVQDKVIIQKNKISLPYGSQGLFFGYEYRNGKLIKVND